MRLEPEVDNSGIGVRCDAEGRLVVLELDPAQQSVQRGLENVPPVPPEGEARLRQTLDKLGQAFTLHSAIGAEGLGHAAREVPADARPVVQLTRANPGLRVRIRVQPLGTGGSGFIAGQGPLAVAADVDGEPVRCTRDHDAERRALTGLLQAIPPLQVASQGTPWDVDRLEACLELLAALREFDDQVVVAWVEGTPLELTPVDDLSSLRLRVGEQGQWLNVQGELRASESEVLSLQQALSKRLGGGGFVALDDNHFVALGEALQQHLQALSAAASDARGGRAGRDALKLPPASLGFVQPWLKDLSNLKADARVKKRLEAIDRAYKSQPKVPSTLDAELRTYQRQGFEFMARVAEFGAGACLADDMGLGKTLMSLALLLHRAEQGPALVVAPTSVRGNWFDEALRFAPALRLREPPASDGNTWTDLEPFDVVVVSYTVLAHRVGTLERVHWSTVVLDESQAIKNASTQRAQAARRLVTDARVALTGTPVENHLGDLHSLMSFLNPGLLGSARNFQERFGKPIQRDGDARAAADLKALIAPFLLRRRKSEVLKELPARTEITLRVEPEAKEQAFVEALRRDALQRLASAGPDGQSPVTILAEITRMRRAACHPTLADPRAGIGVGSAKLDRLMLLLHDLKEEGHRTLVFSQFVGFLELARERLSSEGLSYQYLDGSTSEAQRRKAVRAFQSGEGDAFLISLKAGGFGLNLTAADYVIHVDPWWNPAVEAQASDRAHRIGQVRPVTVYRLVNAASIEERVLALHGRKKELAEELLQDTDQPTRLDSAALMSLLGGEDDAPARGASSNGRAEMLYR